MRTVSSNVYFYYWLNRFKWTEAIASSSYSIILERRIMLHILVILREFETKLTRHEMQENGGDRIERWWIGDVGAGVAQHAHDSVGDSSALFG